MTKEKISAIIVAAGEGKRLGHSTPKAFIDMGGLPLFAHSLKVFDAHDGIAGLVVVASQRMIENAKEAVSALGLQKQVTVVAGGEHRWQSVKNGVEACAAEWVLVHDAARPFVDSQTIDALLEKRISYKCAIVGTPCVDTIRRFENDRCIATIDRNKLIRVGTPQMFHRETLLNAFANAQSLEQPPTDEAMLMEMGGEAVGLAWGNPLNFKITTAQDLELAQALIAARK